MNDTGVAPLISVIIPTIGRLSLRRAILSAVGQELPTGSVEVIVVNDSGCSLDNVANLPGDAPVTFIDTNQRRQSTARNTGASIARGQYFIFLDDDDWLADGALAALVGLFQSAENAVVAYGPALLVEGKGNVLGKIDMNCQGNCTAQTLAGASIPNGGALIEARTFFAAGLFNTLLPNGDEVSLFRRIALLGDFVHTDKVVVNIFRGSTWQTSVEKVRPALDSMRKSREKMLDHPGVFGKLLHSAKTPYWRARTVKAYAASVCWNIRNRRPLRAVSRVVYLIFSAIYVLPNLAQQQFWRGLADTQVPGTFQRALEDGIQETDSD